MAVRCVGADQDGNVIVPALAVDDIAEEKRFAPVFGNPAAKLPPHKRMHFRIFVDRRFDPVQLPGMIKPRDMFVQIGIGSRRRFQIHASVYRITFC